MTKYLHTMIRVSDPDATLAFFELFGVKETRRFDNEKGRFTLIFLAAEGQEGVAEVELTYNWPPEDGSAPEDYTGGRNFGHLAYRVDDIYAPCQRLMDAAAGTLGEHGKHRQLVSARRPSRDRRTAIA